MSSQGRRKRSQPSALKASFYTSFPQSTVRRLGSLQRERPSKKVRKATETSCNAANLAPESLDTAWEDIITPDVHMEDMGEQRSTSIKTVPPGRQKRGKTQQDFILDWLKYEEAYMSTLLWHEAPHSPVWQCCCGSSKEAIFSCSHCHGTAPKCEECVILQHQRLPYHRIRKWNGEFFEQVSLSELGLVISFGHGENGGEPCPAEASPQRLQVLHIDGYHSIAAAYCTCSNSQPHHLQLFEGRLFSASIDLPKSAFTFELLQQYRIHHLEAKTSASAYVESLYRLTDDSGLSDLPSRVREFRRVSRLWLHLQVRKHSGAYGTRHASQPLTIGCPACPQPGINIPLDWQQMVEKRDHWQIRRYVHFDANFRLVLSKKEKRNPVDHSFWLNGGFFAEPAQYKEYLVKVKAYEQEESNKYVNSDYAISHILSSMTGVSEVVVSYDIACQYRRNFQERFRSMLGILNLPRAINILFNIPKFHLAAHQEECRDNYSLNYTKGVGRTDGEGIERLWSGANRLSGSTMRMTPNGRMDTINYHFNDWNWRKACKMGNVLLGRYSEATIKAAEFGDILADLTSLVGDDKAQEWATLEENFEPQIGTPSIFRPAKDAAPTSAQILERLTRVTQEEPVLPVPLNQGQPALAFWIYDGLQIEESQARLAALATTINDGAMDIARIGLNRNRLRMVERIDAWKARCPLAIEQELGVESDDNDDADGEEEQPGALPGNQVHAEHLKLPLPSRLPPPDQNPVLGEIEKELREGHAFDYLRQLRKCLAERLALSQERQSHIRGQRDLARSQRVMRTVEKEIKFLHERYTATFTSICTLGEVHPALRALNKEDLSTKNVFDQSTQLGRGYNIEVPWIWRHATDGLQEQNFNWLEEVQRVQFLEVKTTMDRWVEEKKLSKAELGFCKGFFEHWQQIWRDWSGQAESAGARAHGAEMAATYGKMALELNSKILSIS